eukprot:757429-Hanusia_phi.AAC.3
MGVPRSPEGRSTSVSNDSLSTQCNLNDDMIAVSSPPCSSLVAETVQFETLASQVRTPPTSRRRTDSVQRDPRP